MHLSRHREARRRNSSQAISPKRQKFIPRGVLRVSSDGDDRMGVKIKTQKNPQSFQQNPKNSLDQKLTPKKSHAELPSLKNFQKGLNDIIRKKTH